MTSDLMADLRQTLRDTEVRLTFTFAFSATGTRHGVLVEHRPGYTGRWVKHPVAIYPNADETVADVMHMLATIRAEETQQ